MKRHSSLKAALIAAAALLSLGACNNNVQQTESSAVTAAPETSVSVQVTETEQSAETEEIPETEQTAEAVQTADTAGEKADEPAEEAPLAGTYLLVAKAGMETARSTSEERILPTLANALEYCKKKGEFNAYVINGDGTGRRYFPDSYKSVCFEDGHLYSCTGGAYYELNGNILLTGYEDGSGAWGIYYRLTDEQTAGLPEPPDAPVENDNIIKIYSATYSEYKALTNALYSLRDAGEDPEDHLDELTALVNEVGEQEAAELERRWREHEQENTGITSFFSFDDKQLTRSDIYRLNGGNVPICTDDAGNVSFIGGTCTDKPVENEQDAYKVAESVLTLIGGDEETHLMFLRKFTAPGDISYYTFTNCSDYNTLCRTLNVKVMVGKDNKMLGLSAAAVKSTGYLEMLENIDKINEEQARTGELTDPSELPEIVYESGGYDRSRFTVYDELTGTTVIYREKGEFQKVYDYTLMDWYQKVWIVYTNNPGDDKYPYLAHYISTNGAYLYSLPVAEPSDAAALSGYPAVYTFYGMTPAQWTGQVQYSDGHSETLTVPVMKDEETGKYYLADIERKIAAADCYEFYYNDYNLDMISSDTNDDWDDYYLITYSNLIKVWDYYDKYGYTAPNGSGNPALMLFDYCDKDHNPVDNASYNDYKQGWNLFNFDSLNNLGEALDIVAHEYTHAFTSDASVICNYENDNGAIFEFFGDIMGQIFKFELTDSEDKVWAPGETTGYIDRCAADPHKYSRPEYVWDIYYAQNAENGFERNDYGGVHINSSIPFHIAYKLVTQGNMTNDEALRFWMNLNYLYTVSTDFKQIGEIIPWLTETLGMNKYTTLAQQYVDEARLSESGMPEQLEENTAFITLKLPDDKSFDDGCWVMYIDDSGSNMGYQSNYRSPDDIYKNDEGDAGDITCTIGESKYGTMNSIVKPGSYYINLVHLNPDTGERDKKLYYNNGVWQDSALYGMTEYWILEGCNVLSAEGLGELTIDS